MLFGTTKHRKEIADPSGFLRAVQRGGIRSGVAGGYRETGGDQQIAAAVLLSPEDRDCQGSAFRYPEHFLFIYRCSV